MADLPAIDPTKFAMQPVGADDASISELSKSLWLPRLQCMDKGSKAVADGKATMGRLYFVRGADSMDDMTASVEALVFARRPKAMEYGKSNVSSFDVKDPEFQRIRDAAEAQGFGSGCTFGPEYLLWLRANRSWCTMFCNSASSRKSSADMNTVLLAWREGRIKLPAVIIKASKKQNDKGWWFSPDFSSCSTPFSEIPAPEDIELQVQKFINPPKSGIERAEPADQRG